jgi:hypothetical protein
MLCCIHIAAGNAEPGVEVPSLKDLAAAAVDATAATAAASIIQSDLESCMAALRKALGHDTSSISALTCLQAYLKRLGYNISSPGETGMGRVRGHEGQVEQIWGCGCMLYTMLVLLSFRLY